MTGFQEIADFLIHYGYWIAVPLMIAEGPIVTILLGFLSSYGIFSLFVAIPLAVFSDLISDYIYFLFGYFGGPHVLKRFRVHGLESNGELQNLKQQFERHPWRYFFGAKVLTGLAVTTFSLAGVTRMKYSKILKYTIPGGIIWSSGLATLGYYFGQHTTTISKFLSRAGITAFSILAAFLLYRFWFGKYIAKKFAIWRRLGLVEAKDENLKGQTHGD